MTEPLDEYRLLHQKLQEALNGAQTQKDRGRRSMLLGSGVLDMEVPMVAMLAWLLDPQNDHGLGRGFIEGLLSKIGVRLGSDGVTVRTEVRCADAAASPDFGRRLDLLIEQGDTQVVIEAKIWSVEQPGQLAAYKKLYPRATLVFLSQAWPAEEAPRDCGEQGDGDRVRDGKGDGWTHLDWSDVHEALLAAVGQAVCASTLVLPAVLEYCRTLSDVGTHATQFRRAELTFFLEHRDALEKLHESRRAAAKELRDGLNDLNQEEWPGVALEVVKASVLRRPAHRWPILINSCEGKDGRSNELEIELRPSEEEKFGSYLARITGGKITGANGWEKVDSYLSRGPLEALERLLDVRLNARFLVINTLPNLLNTELAKSGVPEGWKPRSFQKAGIVFVGLRKGDNGPGLYVDFETRVLHCIPGRPASWPGLAAVGDFKRYSLSLNELKWGKPGYADGFYKGWRSLEAEFKTKKTLEGLAQGAVELLLEEVAILERDAVLEN